MVIYGLKVFALLVLASLVFGRPAAVMQSTQGAGQDTENIKRSFEVALSGGVAGGFATGLLYPIDTLKTIRQSDRSLQSVSEAFETVRSSGVVTLYSGVLPAVLGRNQTDGEPAVFLALATSRRWLGHVSCVHPGLLPRVTMSGALR